MSPMSQSDEKDPSGPEELFLKGVAISVWQNGGDTCDSNWSRFVKKRKFFGLKGTVVDGTLDTFPGFWERYCWPPQVQIAMAKNS